MKAKKNIIQEIILQSGKEQKEIAELMGISPQLLNYLIRKPKNLRPDDIVKIAKAVDRSPRNLFSLIIAN